MTLKKYFLFSAFCSLAFMPTQAQTRNEIQLPNIDGYQTLKCDFHMHTVFSDGLVWPTVRVDEAYREGLDAIALTEHIEHSPHKADIVANHNRSYELCKKLAANRNILLVKGSEITRPMAPGHFNALFLQDSEKLDVKDWREAFKEAKRQGAFIFWNHPGWERQQPDSTQWFPEHTELLNMGCMNGIEVQNGRLFTPEAMAWCEKYNLAMLGTSDIHQPIQTDYNFAKGEHRPMTLVFAKERSLQGIREALDHQRTAVYTEDKLLGKACYLKPLFEKAFQVEDVKMTKNTARIVIFNNTDVPLKLKKTHHADNLNYFRNATIAPHSRYTMVINLNEGVKHGKVEFEVTNFIIAPGKGLPYTYSF